ncbi:uncharacterized protein LOC123220115 isoform X3 [Mangifera indica]|uniref:uncharacterized protein LOC123220115 isoform X3 n=1 Tax=Mangifera indica TaxID=29780 RepID=UPI001CFA77C3|nr:uncharacterized protein LOC123220115 isoform X3 [Mangifera indica]
MEIELEPRVKALSYKVKGMSRESPSQKASHVLDTTSAITGPPPPTPKSGFYLNSTNHAYYHIFEFITSLSLNGKLLLAYVIRRIFHRKFALNNNLHATLADYVSMKEKMLMKQCNYILSFNQPETFVKVRPRCEAPRRDMIYPMNYTPCRYVRISCLRGNPIAIFFIQLIGVSVAGLEPEFQPVVNHMLPLIMSHKQDAHDMHLQLLQDITNRLLVFLPQLEVDLASFSDDAESSLRFLATLSGPFYPILHIIKERETARLSSSISDSEVSRNSQSSSALTVSSNFEPRRSRGMFPFVSSTSISIAFRPDAIFMLLRKAYKDSNLGTICRKASRVLQKLIEPVAVHEVAIRSDDAPSDLDEMAKSEVSNPVPMVDYSELFGEEFQIPSDSWDFSILNILDIGAVEEGILHVLYACASQPILCGKLAESSSDFWSALPLVQALLPALRPSMSSCSDQADDSFPQWIQPFVQQALSQIVVTSSSSLYQPLLHACAGYLSSFSPSHAKAACVLIDLCLGVMAPWMAQVVAKIDLVVELVEDLLGTIQGACHSGTRARAALKYILVALSGQMDDILGKYKEVKHKILFLFEMLEPFLDPVVLELNNTTTISDVSFTFTEKQKQTCMIALNVIRTAVQKSAVLPCLESEWRLGTVAPSVLLSILGPHMQLPPEIDLCKSSVSQSFEQEPSSKLNSQDVSDVKTDMHDVAVKMDFNEDASLFFASPELRSIGLTIFPISLDENLSDSSLEQKHVFDKNFTSHCQNGLLLDAGFATEYFNLRADYSQLIYHRDCELKASEFRCLASDLHSQNDLSIDGHDAAIDALLLAAECYVNPFFVTSFRASSNILTQMKVNGPKPRSYNVDKMRRISGKDDCDLETISDLEKRRDKTVLQLLLEAAELDRRYRKRLSDGEDCPSYCEGFDEQVLKLSPHDLQSADAVTLLRQNEALLCSFLIQWLQRDQNYMHEILLHCLVFFLHSATKIYCAPELVIDIILGSAEHLNGMLLSFHCQLKEGNHQLNSENVHWVQRRWILLQRLVIASSGSDDVSDFAVHINKGLRHGNLIPPTAWMQKISTFTKSASPLVRFLGWMAISRFAKQFIKERLFLVSDLSQLTYLVSIFADELALVDKVVDKKHEDMRIKKSGLMQTPVNKGFEPSFQQYGDQSFQVIYPELSRFFPNMKRQFDLFEETILEAVGLQLRSLPSSVMPDVLCWFSDLCLWPFLQKEQIITRNSADYLKGFIARNAKAVILYVLEAIVIEHMEAMVPEIPRVVQVLVSLCRASYCDVSFLNSILQLLKPIISYSLHKVSDEEQLLADDSCLNFESLCFNELFINIGQRQENQESVAEKGYSRALTIFVLASIFPDLSFQRRREMLQCLALWTDFPRIEPTTSFHDYLCAFQGIMESCKALLVQTLRYLSVIPLQLPQFSDVSTGTPSDNGPELHSWFLDDAFQSSSPTKASERQKSNNFDAVISNKKNYHLSTDELEDFTRSLEGLIAKLYPSIEVCYNFHHQLAKKLTIVSAQNFTYSRCLSSIAPIIQNVEEDVNVNPLQFQSVDQFQLHWKNGLGGLAEIIVMSQENHCWEVASVMLDCILGVPYCFQLDNVIDTVCSAIKNFSCNAPKIAWRLQSDKWLSVLFARGIQSLKAYEVPLVDLFCTLLSHPEPEQRFVALQHLGKLVGQDVDEGSSGQYAKICNKLVSTTLSSSIPEPLLSLLVTSTWDQVVVLASSDASLPLKTRAMALLVDFIPFADRHQLQSFLMAADSVLHGFGKVARPVCEGPLLQLSLALIASACLYSPAEDISLIPHSIWKDIETLGLSQTEGRLGDLEKKACQVLCRLRIEGDGAKEALKEAFASNSLNQVDPEFGTTRESILQELEEAEMELDIIQKECATHESPKNSTEGHQIPTLAAFVKDDNRLQQIKNSILSLEKSKLREDIVAHRQKKLVMRRARQKYLEEAALREAELLQELDKERTAEVEKEIERQRLLELERAKSRELRHILDMEKERQTQRELQRELEQAESGLRPSRRDFSSSSHSSRPRDRYRERENGRSGTEGTARTSGGGLQAEISGSNSSMGGIPTMVLSGSRSFSGQPPTILQSRDRSDDCGSSYEENFDGSKDSGDTGSVGDPESISAFDGQSSGFGLGQRHGSRGSKSSRQVMERREKEGRREGKWERKHS